MVVHRHAHEPFGHGCACELSRSLRIVVCLGVGRSDCDVGMLFTGWGWSVYCDNINRHWRWCWVERIRISARPVVTVSESSSLVIESAHHVYTAADIRWSKSCLTLWLELFLLGFCMLAILEQHRRIITCLSSSLTSDSTCPGRRNNIGGFPSPTLARQRFFRKADSGVDINVTSRYMRGIVNSISTLTTATTCPWRLQR